MCDSGYLFWKYEYNGYHRADKPHSKKLNLFLTEYDKIVSFMSLIWTSYMKLWWKVYIKQSVFSLEMFEEDAHPPHTFSWFLFTFFSYFLMFRIVSSFGNCSGVWRCSFEENLGRWFGSFPIMKSIVFLSKLFRLIDHPLEHII